MHRQASHCFGDEREPVGEVMRWRERAAQMRALAVDTKDKKAAALMLTLADDYDKLADRAEQRAKPPPLKKATPPGDRQPGA